VGAGEGGAELRGFASCHTHIDTESGKCFPEFGGIGPQHIKLNEPAAFGCIGGGMHAPSAPFNEEGKQAMAIVLQPESFPLQRPAVGTIPGAIGRAVEGDAGSGQTVGLLCNV
jgi:hypothetical protein